MLRVDVVPLRALARQATRNHVDASCQVNLVVRYKFPATDLGSDGEIPEADLDALNNFFVGVQDYLRSHQDALGITNIEELEAGLDEHIIQYGQYTGVARISVDVADV